MESLLIFLKSKYISIFFMSMLPVTEVKGSLILAATFGLNPVVSVIVSLVGSGVIIVLLTHLFSEILAYLKTTKFKDFAQKLEEKVKKQEKNLTKVEIKTKKKLPVFWQTFLKSVSVFLFVIIPFPGTGVYMGSALASFLKLNKLVSILSITIANILGAIVMQLIISGIITVL